MTENGVKVKNLAQDQLLFAVRHQKQSARQNNLVINLFATLDVYGGEQGIRTPGTLRLNGFQDRRIRPLCQLSVNDHTTTRKAGSIRWHNHLFVTCQSNKSIHKIRFILLIDLKM